MCRCVHVCYIIVLDYVTLLNHVYTYLLFPNVKTTASWSPIPLGSTTVTVYLDSMPPWIIHQRLCCCCWWWFHPQFVLLLLLVIKSRQHIHHLQCFLLDFLSSNNLILKVALNLTCLKPYPSYFYYQTHVMQDHLLLTLLHSYKMIWQDLAVQSTEALNFITVRLWPNLHYSHIHNFMFIITFCHMQALPWPLYFLLSFSLEKSQFL